MSIALPALVSAAPPSPEVRLRALDQLWFQVSGTVCNLRCRHCFISCAPDNHSFWFMEREQVSAALQESRGLGVKEYYFTGGEPFMHREMIPILADTLSLGPATVLTNATLLPQRRVRELAAVERDHSFSLEMRVSLDGVTAEMNDAIRGEGAFERCMDGIANLVAEGFLPIITTMQSWEDAQTEQILQDFQALLAGVGYDRPRLKILPPLLMGEEANRSRGYEATERVTSDMLHGFPDETLICSSARLVTARGVYACPILLESPSARLGDTLSDAVSAPATLTDPACFTCYLNGSICSNMPVSGRDHQ